MGLLSPKIGTELNKSVPKMDIEIDNIYINNTHSLRADPMDAKTEAEFNALWGGEAFVLSK